MFNCKLCSSEFKLHSNLSKHCFEMHGLILAENETTEDEETYFDQGWSSESSDDTDSDSNQEALGANVGNGSESYDEIHFESTDEETNSDNGQLACTKKAWMSRRLHIPFSIAYSTQYTKSTVLLSNW